MDYNYICPTNLKDGLSGFMKVRNEEAFIEAAIDSIIDSLDELVIVYNDCTDSTPEIIERKQKEYPDKIRAYPYNHDVLAFRLSEEEFDLAKSFPNNSQRLFCNQCNFALSQVKYKYALVVDADQFYFSNVIDEWRTICSMSESVTWNFKCFVGQLFAVYLSIYRKLSLVLNHSLHRFLPKGPNILYKYYREYAKWCLLNGTGCISLSGLNVFKDGEWYVPFDRYNVNPPYNGEGDHLIFKVSPDTFFSKFCYLKQGYSVVEKFNHPYRVFWGGLAWFHQHANRVSNWSKVKEIKDKYPEDFVEIDRFTSIEYENVYDKLDKNVHTIYQRAIYAIVHKLGLQNIKKNIHLLK